MAEQYTNLSALQDRLGESGVNLRINDRPTAITGSINQASRRLDFFLLPRYGAGLTGSAWVADACATLAAVYLCLRLGNPPPEGVLFAYEELLGKDGQGGLLERIRKSLANVPDIAALVSGAPRLTNVHVREYPVPHPVAEPARSTDGVVPQPRRNDNTDPLRRWSDWGGW